MKGLQCGSPFFSFNKITEFDDKIKRQRALSICQTEGLNARVRFCVEQLATAWHMACHGLGAAFVSDVIIREAHNAPDMLYYRLSAPEATRCFRAVMRRRGYVSHSMQAFIALARQTAGLPPMG